jgi:hypothetical protein
LNERRVEQIAQCDCVARLEPDEVFPRPDQCFGWNRRQLIQVARMFFGPVEHDHRRRDLGQASDLPFVSRRLLFQNIAGLRIHDYPGLRGVKWARGRETEREGKKSDEKAAKSSHG